MSRLFPVLLIVLLAGCAEPPPTSLRVGVNPWVGYDPLVLAAAQGALAEPDIRIVELASNSDSQRALRNGLLDAAALTLDETLRLADSGLPLRIIAVLDQSLGGDAVLARPEIGSPAALRGRVIALEQTAVGALVLERLLAAGDLQRADVRLLHMEAAQHGAALSSGRVDAVITFEPIRSWLLARGFRVVFDSRAMAGEIMDVLVVRADALDGSALPRWAALLGAWEQARLALRDEDDLIARLAPGADLTPAGYRATLDGLSLMGVEESARLLGGPVPELPQAADELIRLLRRLQLLRADPDWGNLLDARPVALARAAREAPP